MNRHRKFIAILCFVGLLLIACGPKKQKDKARPDNPAPVEQADAEDGETNLEADCFAGDQAACDQLGH